MLSELMSSAYSSVTASQTLMPRGSLRKRKIVWALVGLVALLIATLTVWSLSASPRGRWKAQSDLRQGHVALLTYGLEPPQRRVIARLLRERYGVELRTVAGDIVSEDLTAYVRAYNEVMQTAINNKFGHDVYKECAEQAYGPTNANSR